MTNAICTSNSLPIDEPDIPTAIVAPNPLMCESLSRFLQGTAFNIVALASCIDKVSSPALSQDRAVLLIIDTCDHPGEACRQIQQFRQDHQEARIVVLANHCDPGAVARVLGSGASGYFATIATCDDFIKSLELVMGGQTILPSEGVFSMHVRETIHARDAVGGPDNVTTRAPVLVGSANMPKFSTRELSILRRLTKGSSNKEIAREFDIAEGTVKVHVKAILRKIEVKNRTQAAIWALNNRSQVFLGDEGPSENMAAGWPVKIGAPKTPAAVNGQTPAHVNGKAQQFRCAAGKALSC